MHKRSKHRILRFTILAAVLILTTILGNLHSIIKLYPAIDAFCPFGGLESLFSFLKYNVFLKRIALSSLILFGAVMISAVIFRRTFCGNICPLGFLQEIPGFIGRKLLKRRFVIHPKIDRYLRLVKFPLLVVILGLTWLNFNLVFRPFDPWAAYHHIGSDELISGYLLGFIILIISLIASFFSDRIFCKYICPMGAVLVPASKIGIFKIRNNKSVCTDCGRCDEICQMNISVSDSKEVTSGECISCMDCVAECPVEALTIETGKNRKRKIDSRIFIIMSILIFVLIVGITTFTKQFVWKTPTDLPQKTERLLWGPQKIKADNTFEDIIMIFRINPQFIAQEWSLAEADFTRTFSELEIEAADIQLFIEKVYDEAGLNPRKIYAGGSCGGH